MHSTDSVLGDGVAAQLRGQHCSVTADLDCADVVIVATDELCCSTIETLRTFRLGGHEKLIVIASSLDESQLLDAVDAGALAFVRRCESSASIMRRTVTRVMDGDGSLPQDLLGTLMRQVRQLRSHVVVQTGRNAQGFSPREVDVLRLIAEGHDTIETARQLSYSERTVKLVVHDVMTRFQLKNRSHAVAYAIRQGVI